MVANERSSQDLIRRPRQERGQKRFDAILDAAAAILAEVGMTGFTIHGIAAKASTSIGSMYHFFPDRESVLAALVERHVVALGELLQRLHAVDVEQWAALPLDKAVDAVFDPLLTYIEEHPELLKLPHPQHDEAPHRDHDELDQLTVEMFERFIAARLPRATKAERRLRAEVIHGLGEGVATRAAHAQPKVRATMMRELKRAVTSYLMSYERK